MTLREDTLRQRSKQFALRVMRIYSQLPSAPDCQIIGRQLFRSATSVAANHRAACRARSKAEFCAKLGIVVEEIDESLFWLELLIESGLIQAGRLDDLRREADELTAIFAAAYHTAKRRRTPSS